MQRKVKGLFALAGAFGLLTVLAPVADAHDVVIGGNPAEGEHLDEFPDHVLLEFSGEPKEGFNTFAISDADTNEILFTAEPTVEGRNVGMRLPDDLNPGPGNYRIGFQITSSDGHSTRGMTTFSVGDEALDASSASDVSTEQLADDAAETSGIPSWAIIGVSAVAVLGLAAAVIAAIGKNHRRNTSSR